MSSRCARRWSDGCSCRSGSRTTPTPPRTPSSSSAPGRDVHSLVTLTLGTGVGGGVVLAGKLFRGWAELGHIVIVEDGDPCNGACTGRGHVESYCSGTAVDRLARRVLGPNATARDLVAARHPALDAVGHHLGVAIGSLINIFNPQLVVIGGGFGVAAFDLLLPAAGRRSTARRSRPAARSRSALPSSEPRRA